MIKNISLPKHIVRPVLITLFVLAIPYLAMKYNWQVTDPGNPNSETVNWDIFDFIVMGSLILVVTMTYELISSNLKNRNSRMITAVVLLIAFVLIWAELAVGIFNTPFAGS